MNVIYYILFEFIIEYVFKYFNFFLNNQKYILIFIYLINIRG